jgi:hypothetical protein
VTEIYDSQALAYASRGSREVFVISILRQARVGIGSDPSLKRIRILINSHVSILSLN